MDDEEPFSWIGLCHQLRVCLTLRFLRRQAGSVLTLLNWNSAPVESLSVTVRVDHDVAEVTAVNGGTKLKFTTTKDTTRAGGFLVAFSLPLEHCDIVTLPAKK